MTIWDRPLLLSCIAAACLSPGSAIAQNASRIGAPVENPGAWFNDIDVPAEAVARGETGRTKVELNVSVTGEIAGCKVIESSGWQVLDDATCASARLHGRFLPQLDASGTAVPFTYTLPGIRYTLSYAKSHSSVDGYRRLVSNRTIRLAVSAASIVKSCRSLNPDATDAEACTDFPIGRAIPGYPANAGARTVTVSQTFVMDAPEIE